MIARLQPPSLSSFSRKLHQGRSIMKVRDVYENDLVYAWVFRMVIVGFIISLLANCSVPRPNDPLDFTPPEKVPEAVRGPLDCG